MHRAWTVLLQGLSEGSASQFTVCHSISSHDFQELFFGDQAGSVSEGWEQERISLES